MHASGESNRLCRAVGWLEDTEVDEPSTTVELGEDSLDEPLAFLEHSLEYDDTADGLGALAGAGLPTEGDSVAVVPEGND